MEYFAQINALVMGNLPQVLLLLTGVILVALVIFISINMKLARLNRRYEKMMQGMDGKNIEQLLLAKIEEVQKLTKKVDETAAECKRLDNITRTCMQNIGVVRFAAFENTGSDLSFALALMDAQNNGVVLSSIFARSESRIYAKPLVGGQSSYLLSEEEKQAIKEAMKK